MCASVFKANEKLQKIVWTSGGPHTTSNNTQDTISSSYLAVGARIISQTLHIYQCIVIQYL